MVRKLVIFAKQAPRAQSKLNAMSDVTSNILHEVSVGKAP